MSEENASESTRHAQRAGCEGRAGSKGSAADARREGRAGCEGSAADACRAGRSCRLGRAGRIWVARALIALVFFVNVQCAVQFVLWPDAYTAAYQLEGASARAIVQSFGICFLMWNATYPPVIARPDRHRALFAVVLAQQAIGLVGESLLLVSLGPGLEQLAASVIRFIVFDGLGLVELAVAFALSRPVDDSVA